MIPWEKIKELASVFVPKIPSTVPTEYPKRANLN